MPESDINTEAGDYLLGLGVQAYLDIANDEARRELARELPIFTTWRMLRGVAGTSVYTVPVSLVELLQVHSYPTELDPAPLEAALDLVLPQWRAGSGTPQVWSQEDQDRQKFRVYPTPNATGQAITLTPLTEFTSGSDTDRNNNLFAFFVHEPAEADIPEWAEALLMLKLVAKEAGREGEMNDAVLAQTCLELHSALVQMMASVMDGWGGFD